MTTWSLPKLLAGLHDDIQGKLEVVRKTLGHPAAKGDGSERVWLELMQAYLPHRYKAEKAHVVDSKGAFSEQIDVVIFDRQYSPFIFQYEGQIVIPAESVYAAFEAKQAINANQIEYARNKVSSVRKLFRTSLPIPTAAGTTLPKPLHHIIGGLLTLDSDWSPPLGQSLGDALTNEEDDSRLDMGCVAAHGIFVSDAEGKYSIFPGGKPATAFLFEFISRLQSIATVPMIDVRAYAQWLK